MKIIAGILALAVATWAGEIKIAQNKGRLEVSNDMAIGFKNIIVARYKSNPMVSGRAEFALVTNAAGDPVSVCVDKGTVQDDTLLLALGTELYSRRFASSDTMQLSLVIPLIGSNNSVMPDGAPLQNPQSNPMLLVIRRIEDEDDDHYGHVYLENRYLGSTYPNQNTLFELAAGRHYILFQKDPDEEEDFNIVLADLKPGYVYCVRQEFIDTPLFHSIAVKALDPSSAKVFMKENPLPNRNPSKGLSSDIDTDDYEEILEEYFEDVRDEESDFYEEYIDNKDVAISKITVGTGSCKSDPPAK